MKKIATAMLLGLVLAGTVTAKDEPAKGHVKKEGTAVAPPAQPSPNAPRLDSQGSKGNVSRPAGADDAKDPYAVPLLREARPLN